MVRATVPSDRGNDDDNPLSITTNNTTTSNQEGKDNHEILDIFAEDSHDDLDKSDISEQEESLSDEEKSGSNNDSNKNRKKTSSQIQKKDSDGRGNMLSSTINIEEDSMHEHSVSDVASENENEEHNTQEEREEEGDREYQEEEEGEAMNLEEEKIEEQVKEESHEQIEEEEQVEDGHDDVDEEKVDQDNENNNASSEEELSLNFLFKNKNKSNHPVSPSKSGSLRAPKKNLPRKNKKNTTEKKKKETVKMGRPRKYKVEVGKTGDKSVVKRGRGRLAKTNVKESTIKTTNVPLERNRRQRKKTKANVIEDETKEAEIEIPTRRSIGRSRKRKPDVEGIDVERSEYSRPRKFRADTTNSSIPDLKPALSETSSKSSGRSRGRYRKVKTEIEGAADTSITKTTTNISNETKKSIGRPRKHKTTIKEKDLGKKTEEGETNKDESLDSEEEWPDSGSTTKKGGKKKRKVCPICKQTFVQNGFFMHLNKCRKFKDWNCEWCKVDIYSFAPKPAVFGPNGPFTLCPECGKQYKREFNKKNAASRSANKQTQMRKQLPQRNRKPVIRLNPSQQSKVDDSEYHTDSDITGISIQSPSQHSVNEEKQPREITTENESSVGNLEREIASSGKSECEKAVLPIPESNPIDRIDWCTQYDCMLLLSALNQPKRLITKGPGVWMLSTKKESEATLTNEIIQTKWNELVYGNRANDIFSGDVPSQIMSTCIANVNLQNTVNAVLESTQSYNTEKEVKEVVITTDNEETSAPKEKIEVANATGTKLFNTYAIKKSYVSDGDPRPHADCCWCGPKLKQSSFDHVSRERRTALTMPSCASCIYLFNVGWRLHVYHKKQNDIHGRKEKVLDYRYTCPEGKGYRSMKSFLIKTTGLIVASGKNSKITTNNSLIQSNLSEKKDLNRSKYPEVEELPLPQPTKASKNEEVVENDDDASSVGGDDIAQTAVLRLPTISELLDEEEGLLGILQYDVLQILRTNFGTCMDIAVQVLQCLSVGEIPNQVYLEKPFARGLDESNNVSAFGGPPPTRYLGVTRLFEQKKDKESSKVYLKVQSKFGVEFPAFSPLGTGGNSFDDDASGTVSKQTKTPYLMPSCAQTGEKKLLLRADIDEEEVAGQLYSFVYRILYGACAADNARLNYSSSDDKKGKSLGLEVDSLGNLNRSNVITLD